MNGINFKFKNLIDITGTTGTFPLKGQSNEKVYEFLTWDGSFSHDDFSNMGSLDVKPVSLICKMLPKTFSNSNFILGLSL
jgi:hypothetical protein